MHEQDTAPIARRNGQPSRIPVPCAVCGTIRMVKPSMLANGRGRHCGPACRAIGIRTHGETLSGEKRSVEYMAWSSIKARCLNPSAPNYPNYGGRGIIICDRWRENFGTFLEDVGRRPGPGYSIDRIDVNGHYETSNVRWATAQEQSVNRRNNRLLTINGETRCMSEWAALFGLSKECLFARIKRGWTPERALTEPPSRRTRR